MTPRFPLLALLLCLLGTNPAWALGNFSGPNGDLGANLSTDPSQASRGHLEFSYFTEQNSEPPLPSPRNHALTLKLGFGAKVSQHWELTFGVAGEGLLQTGSVASDHYAIGNLMLGAGYVRAFGPLLLRLGGAVAFGPWNQRGGELTEEGNVQVAAGYATHVFQDAWYFLPGHVHFVVPMRAELWATDAVAATLDFQPDLALGLGGRDSGLLMVVAPGLSLGAGGQLTVGLRLPIQVNSLQGDVLQTALEPFLKLDLFDSAFLGGRFTLNLDDPGGFSFDPGRVWGLHVAIGGTY